MAATCRENSCCACSRVRGGGIVIVTGAIVVPVIGVAAPVLVPELGESRRTILLSVCASESIWTMVASPVTLPEEGEEEACGRAGGAARVGVGTVPGDNDEAMCVCVFGGERGRQSGKRERHKGTVEIATDQDERKKKKKKKGSKTDGSREERGKRGTGGRSKSSFRGSLCPFYSATLCVCTCACLSCGRTKTGGGKTPESGSRGDGRAANTKCKIYKNTEDRQTDGRTDGRKTLLKQGHGVSFQVK